MSLFKKIGEFLFGPYQAPREVIEVPPPQVQNVAANTVAIQAVGDINVSGVPYKVTLPTESEKAIAVKDWPFPGYGEKEVGKSLAEAAKAADAATPAKKPRKPRAKKAAK